MRTLKKFNRSKKNVRIKSRLLTGGDAKKPGTPMPGRGQRRRGRGQRRRGRGRGRGRGASGSKTPSAKIQPLLSEQINYLKSFNSLRNKIIEKIKNLKERLQKINFKTGKNEELVNQYNYIKKGLENVISMKQKHRSKSKEENLSAPELFERFSVSVDKRKPFYKKICDNLQKDIQEINNINIILGNINKTQIESLKKNPKDKPILEKLILILKRIVKEFPSKFTDYRQDIKEGKGKAKELNKGKTPTNNAPANGKVKRKGNTKVITSEIKRKSERINSLISKLRDYTEYCNTIEEAYARKHGEVKKLVGYIDYIFNNMPELPADHKIIYKIIEALDNLEKIKIDLNLPGKLDEQDRLLKQADINHKEIVEKIGEYMKFRNNIKNLYFKKDKKNYQN